MRIEKREIGRHNAAVRASEYLLSLDRGELSYLSPRYPVPCTPHRKELHDNAELFYIPGQTVRDVKFLKVAPLLVPDPRTFLESEDPETGNTYAADLGITLPRAAAEAIDDIKAILELLPEGLNLVELADYSEVSDPFITEIFDEMTGTGGSVSTATVANSQVLTEYAGQRESEVVISILRGRAIELLDYYLSGSNYTISAAAQTQINTALGYSKPGGR